MISRFKIVVGIAGATFAVAGRVRSQTPESDPHRNAVALSLDASGFPDAFSTRCGSLEGNGGAGFGAGISVIHRPRMSVLLQGDLRASWMPVGFGCDLPLEIVQVSPGVFETRPGYMPVGGTPSLPLLRTLFRAGLETPPSVAPVVRAMLGAGVIWSGRPTPLGSLALGVSSSNNGPRIYAEFEENVARVRENETRQRYTFSADSTDETPLGTVVVGRSAAAFWGTLRLGVEFPVH